MCSVKSLCQRWSLLNKSIRIKQRSTTKQQVQKHSQLLWVWQQLRMAHQKVTHLRRRNTTSRIGDKDNLCSSRIQKEAKARRVLECRIAGNDCTQNKLVLDRTIRKTTQSKLAMIKVSAASCYIIIKGRFIGCLSFTYLFRVHKVHIFRFDESLLLNETRKGWRILTFLGTRAHKMEYTQASYR